VDAKLMEFLQLPPLPQIVLRRHCEIEAHGNHLGTALGTDLMT
jgi:hypothetical protein